MEEYAGIHVPDAAGSSFDVPFPDVLVEESSDNSSSFDSDPDNLATHDADPYADLMDPNYH